GRQSHELGAHGLALADDVRPRLLRGRDDARGRRALRPGPLRRRLPRKPAPVGRHDRRRYARQQDGAGAAQGLRPDAGAALGDLDGLLRQRRRLLSLFLRRRPRLRPHRARRRLRAGLPADRRGARLRDPPAPGQDPPYQHDRARFCMTRIEATAQAIATRIGARAVPLAALPGEIAIEVAPEELLSVCRELRDAPELAFEQLIDLSGIDYLDYGRSDCTTDDATASGFSRGVERAPRAEATATPGRFAVVYQLL